MFGKKKQFKKVEMPTEEVVDEPEIEEELEEDSESWEAPVEKPKYWKPKEVEEKKPEPKEEVIVVKELPVQSIRSTVKKDGTKVVFITVEEALTQIMNQ